MCASQKSCEGPETNLPLPKTCARIQQIFAKTKKLSACRENFVYLAKIVRLNRKYYALPKKVRLT
jgi:hypothetical protein